MRDSEEVVHLRKYLTGIVGNAPFGIVTLSANDEVGVINIDAVELLGFQGVEPHELVDKHYSAVFANVPELFSVFSYLTSSNQNRESNLFKIQVARYIVNIKIRPLFSGSLIIIEDITKQAELERLLTVQASQDSLTALANRHQFEERAHAAIEKAIRHNLPGALIFIDLDRFKPVNDTAGHAAGDQLLKHVADILLSSVRDRDLVARLGGDEFAILLEDCPVNAALQIAESMRKKVSEFNFVYEENAFAIGLCAGVCGFGKEHDQLSTILNAADNACQIAKNQGRNAVHLADASQDEYMRHKREVGWIPRIQSALVLNKFVLYSQAIFALSDGKSHSEILIRLTDDDGTIVPPYAFIYPAERYDLMTDIDRWVIKNTFENIQPDAYYSINLSGQSMKNVGLAEYIEQLLEANGVDPAKISFEITETAAIQNMDRCVKFIWRLKKLGVKFSLDDFGSGLSSFTYLKNLPVDYLKIDGSFVKDIANDVVSYAMVKSINEIGHAMGLKTIAERVENESIMLKLKEIGVDYAQGYHIEVPKPLALKRAVTA